MSTSTFATLLSTNTDLAWGYITTAINGLLPFVIPIVILSGAIYFVLRHLKVIR